MLLQAATHVAAGQQYPKGALYLVATPIGNLADLTLRAVQVLAMADLVACEDTRVSGRLLSMLGLDKRLTALHQHNEVSGAAAIIQALQEGQRVAYISDAGTPAVSDPGAHLVRAAQAAGIVVVPIPGASSVTTAVSAAGDVHAQGFRFLGFLPAKGQARLTALQEGLTQPASLVLFEAPHRVEALANELGQVAPDRLVTICRELTKQFEEIATIQASSFSSWLTEQAHRQRGEFVLVVHAAPSEEAQPELPEGVQALLRELTQHLPIKQAAALVADATGHKPKSLYETALAWRKRDDEAS